MLRGLACDLYLYVPPQGVKSASVACKDGYHLDEGSPLEGMNGRGTLNDQSDSAELVDDSLEVRLFAGIQRHVDATPGTHSLRNQEVPSSLTPFPRSDRASDAIRNLSAPQLASYAWQSGSRDWSGQ